MEHLDFSNHVQETEVHHFTCFASDQEVFRKGFPRSFKAKGVIGNGQPFVGWRKNVSEDGDLQYVVYRQLMGCITVQVFND